MKFFDRIFACYYFYFIALRKRVKNRDDEDVSALFLFSLNQYILIIALAVLAEKIGLIHKINISPPLALIISWAIFFLWYIYFISNRERRNRIIDDYRYLSKKMKLQWEIITFLLSVTPLVVIISILS